MSQPQANFWQVLCKVATGLVAFVPAARTLATGISDVVQKLVKGRVSVVTPNRIGVETPEQGEMILLLSPRTQVWNGAFVQGIPTEVGDQITAWVSHRQGTVYEAEQLWVNWVSLRGAAANIRSEKAGVVFVPDNSTQSAPAIRIDPQTLIATRDTRSPFAASPITLAEGELVLVTGRKLKDGSILAADVYLPQR